MWLAEVRAWIERQVTVTGEIEQRHLRAWSTALRVPTSDGVMWFKAGRDVFACEARILEVLIALAPDLLPEVVAARPDAGWLLMRDAGGRAREHPVAWPPLLRRYAQLQIAAAAHVDEVLAAGALDNRQPDVEKVFAYLSPATAAGLRARLPEVHERLARLASSPLPATIDHHDLHDGNVYVRDGHARILDWGDAVVGHPFCTLVLVDDPSARASYLESWDELVPRARLLQDLEDVLALRHLLRVVEFGRAIALDPSAAREVEERVRLYVRAD